jgi:hypothetical protein
MTFKRKGRGQSDGGARLVGDGMLTRRYGRLPRAVTGRAASGAASGDVTVERRMRGQGRGRG